MPKNRIVFWILLVFLSPGAFSQDITFQMDAITHFNTTSQFEFQNNTLYAATTGGLLIYDLNNNQKNTFTSVDGIYDHYLTAIARSKYGLLLLGSLNGNLAFFNPGNRAVTNDENLKGTEIVDILAIEDTLWVLSKDFVSVYLYDQDRRGYQFRESYQEFGAAVGNFYAIEYANERIWLANESGLVSAPGDFIRNNLYAGSNWRLQTTLNGLPANGIRDIAKAAAGEFLYLATNNGMSRYDFSTFSNTTAGLIATALTNVAVQNGEIYVADSRRIYQWLGNQFLLLYTSPYANITDLAVGNNNEVWFSLERRGIHNTTQSRSILIDGPLDNSIGEVYVDRNRNLWASSATLGQSSNRGIFVQTSRGWINHYFFSGSYQNLNSSNPIFEDAGQNIWIGSWGGGIVVFDKELNIHTINRAPSVGKVWISSTEFEDTLDVQTQSELQNVLSPALSTTDYVVITDFLQDRQRQSIWILNYLPSNLHPMVEYKATSFGEEAINPLAWNYFNGPFSKNEVHKITQDPFGDLWIANSEGVAQVRLRGDTLAYENYDESDGLKINATTAIAADQDGYVWVGTRSGLSAILNQVVYDFRGTYQPIGLKIDDIFVDSRNNKWFASDKGLSILKASGSPFDPQSWIDIVPHNSSIDPEQLALRANLFKENLPSEQIHSVFLDEETGDVYMGTNAGIAIIRNNPFASTFRDYEQLKVGPNPFILGEEGGHLLNFYNLVANSEIKILTINGQVVRTIDSKNFAENTGAMAQWDGRSGDGKLVATGVYLFLISNDEGQTKAGKVLVVRQ